MTFGQTEMEETNGNRRQRDRIGRILHYLYLGSLCLGVAIAARLVYIQHSWKPDKDVDKYFRPMPTKSVIDPVRGSIIGNDGSLLAMSTPMYQLYMDCTVRKAEFAARKDSTEVWENRWLSKARAFSAGLAKEMRDRSAEDYFRIIKQGREDGSKYVRIGGDIDHETLQRLRALPLMREGQYKSGVIVRKKDSRQYPYGELARRTIGFVRDNKSSQGRSDIGLEGKYDYALHGKEGVIWLKTTDNKEKIQDYDSTYVKPENGMDVRTTLDITLQDIVDKALRKQIDEDKSIEMGCAVLMDVKTGAIRSMVNLTRDSLDSRLRETYNMAIGMRSEPGSVFKTATLMTVLEDGIVKSLDEVIPTNRGVVPGFEPDVHVYGMDEISILHGFEISSNYVFRHLAVNNYQDNPKKFLDKLYLYKLGQSFDFDLDGLQEPFIPSPDSPLWSRTSLGSIGIGYSIQETPLHILAFYNAIANKGKMMKPYLVESIEKDGVVKVRKGPSALNSSICSKATADTLLRALKAVTSDGTAARLKRAKLEVAGKTGTSRQVLTKDEIEKYGMQTPYVTRDGSYHNLATFVGFFPADEPKYSLIICLRSGLIRGSVYGGVLPAAATAEIVNKIHTLDSTWGEELARKGSVPGTAREKSKKRRQEETRAAKASGTASAAKESTGRNDIEKEGRE